MEKAANSSGRSEISSFTKEGISAGMGNSMNISTKATADSMAVTASLWVRLRLVEAGTALVVGSDIEIHSFVLLENTLDALTPPR